jgi:hypothetical protein
VPAESKEQVWSFINFDGPDPYRLPNSINEDFSIVPQVTASDGNATASMTPDGNPAASMTPRRSGRLRDKRVVTYKPLKPAAVMREPPKSSGKKNKTAAPPPGNTEDQPLTFRSELILEPSQLTDELFDAPVEELWLVYGELCHEKAVLERRARAVRISPCFARKSLAAKRPLLFLPVVSSGAFRLLSLSTSHHPVVLALCVFANTNAVYFL